MANKTAGRRVGRIEGRRTARELLPEPTPYWSEEHTCYMENRGGVALPVAATIDEWERVAVEQQARLVASIVPEVVRVRAGPVKAAPVVPGGRVSVIARATGVRSDHPAVDAREMAATGEYTLVDGTEPPRR